MVDSRIQALLDAVRRRLWQGQFVAGARLALWGSAAAMLFAAAVHMAAGPVRFGTALLAIALLWASTMAWAGLRRPSDPDCALWADRHLAGASAFSTLLEMHQAPRAAPDAHALRWLERWASGRVPHALRVLAERRDPARLSRALLSMLACTALATLVLTLPDLAPSSRREPGAFPPTGVADGRAPDAEPTASAERVTELASALRSAPAHRPPDRGDTGRAPAAGPGRTDDGAGSRIAGQPGAGQPGEQAVGKPSLPGAPVDGAPMARAARSSGSGTGRDAGDSRDDRADVGVSPVLRSTIPVERRESGAQRLSPERRADMDRLATFDEDFPVQRAATARADPAPAAATPPPAAAETRLTPTRAAYVQAWMKASGPRR
jgi:hypothetical protein